MSLYTTTQLPRYCKTCAKNSVFASAADGDVLLQYKIREDLDGEWGTALNSAEKLFFEKHPKKKEQSEANVSYLKQGFEEAISAAEACIIKCKSLSHARGPKRSQHFTAISTELLHLEMQMAEMKKYNIAKVATKTTKLIHEIELLDDEAAKDKSNRNGGRLWWLERKSKIDQVTSEMKNMRDAKETSTGILQGLQNKQTQLEGLKDDQDIKKPSSGNSGDKDTELPGGGKDPATPGGEHDGKSPAKPSSGNSGGKDTELPGGGKDPATPGGEHDGKKTGEKIVVKFVGPKGTEIRTSKGGDLELTQGVSDYMVKRLNKSTIGYDAMATMHDEFIQNQMQDKFILYDENGKPMPSYDREDQKKKWDDEPEDIFVIKNTDEDVLGLCVAYSFSVACQTSQFQDFLSKTGLQKTFYIDKWFARPGNGMPLLKTVMETQTFMCDRVMATTLQKNSAAMCKFLFMPDTPFNFCFHRDVEQLIALAQIDNDQANPAALVKNKYKFLITDNEKEKFTLAQYVLFQLASTMTPANDDTTLEHVLESSDIIDQPLQKKFQDLDKFAAWCKQIPDINDPLDKNDAVMKKFEKSIKYLDVCRENMALDLNSLLTKQRIDFLTKVIRQIEYGFLFLKRKSHNEANEKKLKNLQEQVIQQMKTQCDLALGPDKDEFLEAKITSMVHTLKDENILYNKENNWFNEWSKLKEYVDNKKKQHETDQLTKKGSPLSAMVEITPSPPKANSWAWPSQVASGVKGMMKMLPIKDKANTEKPAEHKLKTERYYEKAPKEDGSLEQDTRYVSLEIRVDAHVVENTAVQEAITSAIKQMQADAPDTKIICLYVRISTGNEKMIRTMIGQNFHAVNNALAKFRVSTCPAWMVKFQALWDANKTYYDACKALNEQDKLLVHNTFYENDSLIEELAEINNVLPEEDTKTFIWLQCPASAENALELSEEENILVYLDRLTAVEKSWKFSGGKKAKPKHFLVRIAKNEVKRRRGSNTEYELKVAKPEQITKLRNVKGQVRNVFLQEFRRASEKEGEGLKKMDIQAIIDALNQ